MSTDLTLAFDMNVTNVGRRPGHMSPAYDYRNTSPTCLTSVIRMDRGCPIHQVVERAVEHGGGETGPIWWPLDGEEADPKERATSISGSPIEWCRAGDIARFARSKRGLWPWSKVVLRMIRALPPECVVFVYWS